MQMLGEIDVDKYFENYMTGLSYEVVKKFKEINKLVDTKK